jgi:hypothetical protein
VTSIGGDVFDGCTALTTLKFGHAGTISETNAGRYLFGNGNNSRANTITLYLHSSQVPANNSKVWHGYTWKEILPYP